MVPLLVLAVAVAQGSTCPGLEPAFDALERDPYCLTDELYTLWDRARHQGQESCLREALAARGLPHFGDRARSLTDAPPPSPETEKATRDYYDAPHSLESENFVLRWGSTMTVSETDAELILGYFEEGWSHEVETMGMPQPDGSNIYKFNVYVGDSGAEVPSAYGASGYFSYDGNYQPMIVLNSYLLGYDELWTQATCVHELFHAVQAATGNYVDYYDGSISAWYLEATAMWVEGEVYPENPYYAVFLYAFAFEPHLPLHHFNYPDTEALDESHQYGAAIWPRYLSEIAADWTLVVDSWQQGTPHGDPLVTLDALLQEQGTDLRTTWADFLGHNAVWDYEDGDTYAYYLDYYRDYYRSEDDSVAYTLSDDGESDWIDGPTPLPEDMGAHYIHLDHPEPGLLTAEVEANTEGSSGTPVNWVGRLVVVEDDVPSYLALEFEEGHALLEEEITDGVDEIWLVLGADADDWITDETFDYRFRLWVDTGEDEGADTGLEGEGNNRSGPGCACGTRSAPISSAWLLLAGAAALGSRRRGGPPHRTRGTR